MLRLPADLRGAFKDPLGRVYTDPVDLLRDADQTEGPIIAVGDVVTFHLRQAERDPDVAVIDGKTKREAVDEAVSEVLDGDADRIEVENPPATISEALLDALVSALAADDPTVIFVDGEEDLATLPAIVAAPVGASIVYGQPNEGMVHVPVDEETKAEARELLSKFEGDVDAALARLD
ncbi:GTP-dependent dephospho-CoA kinase family protein [Halogranum rubrum]|uniref:GTP-dependent dephospho-CoA kinase n=1 Tax=Halogranum salarium B-1 TaxID=1210908 RepID=J3JED2_9EURY|nr:GTP-dependent dephospho-CoA kinase family protein [Halogranum salarium]EJN58259.1 hypothetical protein HSB1_36760 [Halogranum salarium B-1]